MSALVMVDEPLAFLLRYPTSRGFGVVTPGLERYGRHTGIDTAAPSGTPVYALEGGVVAIDDDDARFDPDRSATWSGISVQVRHDDGAIAWYAHLSRNLVAAGQRISRGGLIGYVGATGAATGAHLHWEVRVDGKAVDPLAYYRARSREKEGDMATLNEVREMLRVEYGITKDTKKLQDQVDGGLNHRVTELERAGVKPHPHKAEVTLA